MLQGKTFWDMFGHKRVILRTLQISNRQINGNILTIFRFFSQSRWRLRPLVPFGVQQPQIVEPNARRAESSEYNKSAGGAQSDCMVPAGCRRSSWSFYFLPVKFAGWRQGDEIGGGKIRCKVWLQSHWHIVVYFVGKETEGDTFPRWKSVIGILTFTSTEYLHTQVLYIELCFRCTHGCSYLA